MSYSMTNWQDSPSTTTPLSAANLLPYNTAINDLDTRVTAKQPGMSVTSTNANISASINQIVLVDTTSGSVTVTLPSGPADGSRICIKQVVRGSSNTVTVQASGLDTFNTSTGGTTSTITLLRQAATYQYYASSHLWITVSDDMPLDQLDARYVRSVTGGDSSVTIGGTAAAPTVAVNQANILPLGYSSGGLWAPNVYGTLFENMERDDAAGTLLMTTTTKTQLVLLGLVPAGSYSSFKLYVTTAGTSSTLTAALFSASSMGSTSWSRLGSGNVTPTISATGLVSTSLAFTLASPTFVVLEMVLTTASTFPAFAAAATGVPAALVNPSSGCPVSATQNAASAPGSTLNPTTGFAGIAQKIWCALA